MSNICPLPIILHIGHFKTGSSALQCALTHHPVNPASDGSGLVYEYVALVRERILRGPELLQFASNYAARYANSADIVDIVSQPMTDLEECVSQLQGMREQGIVPILSYEAWVATPPKLIRWFTSALKAPLRVVVYLRPPVALLNSWLWQTDSTSSFNVDVWIRSILDTQFKFDEQIENWKNAPNVSCLDIRLPGNSILSDFCKNCRIEEPGDSFAGRSNRSYSKEMIDFVFRNDNADGLDPSDLKCAWWHWIDEAAQQGIGAISELGPSPFVFNEEQVRFIVESTRNGCGRILDWCSLDIREAIQDDPRWWSVDQNIHVPQPPSLMYGSAIERAADAVSESARLKSSLGDMDKLLRITLNGLLAADRANRKQNLLEATLHTSLAKRHSEELATSHSEASRLATINKSLKEQRTELHTERKKLLDRISQLVSRCSELERKIGTTQAPQ